MALVARVIPFWEGHQLADLPDTLVSDRDDVTAWCSFTVFKHCARTSSRKTCLSLDLTASNPLPVKILVHVFLIDEHKRAVGADAQHPFRALRFNT